MIASIKLKAIFNVPLSFLFVFLVNIRSSFSVCGYDMMIRQAQVIWVSGTFQSAVVKQSFAYVSDEKRRGDCEVFGLIEKGGMRLVL